MVVFYYKRLGIDYTNLSDAELEVMIRMGITYFYFTFWYEVLRLPCSGKI